MAIYNVFGTQIDSAYGENGNKLDIAYDTSGTVVYKRNADPYKYYSITSFYNKPRNNDQGFDVYGNYMAIYRDSDYAVQLVNLSTKEIEYTLSTDVRSHGNDISFSNYFYDLTDEFPLLFINGSKNHGLRINLSDMTAKTALIINAPPSGSNWVSYGNAFNNGMTRLYKLGYNTDNYRDSSGFIFLETWDISNSITNPTRISTITREWFPCIQGVALHDDMLWVASGMNHPVKIFALSLSDASIVKTVDLTRTGELEGVGWWYNSSVGKWVCLYGQVYNGIMYYCIDFSSTPTS